MWYNLADDYDLARYKAKVVQLAQKKAMVELTEKRPRSTSQNAYLHTILGGFGLEVGCTLQDVKDVYFKQTVNGDTFIRRRFDRLLGRERVFLRSTADCTSEEISTAITRFREWAAREAGVYLPSGEEHAALLRMQRDVENAKNRL